jgi:hypothetical protein
MISVFGYDATIPRTKNTDLLFQHGYTSSPEMGQAVLGDEAHFDQAARGGIIVTGGRAGANSPAYIDDVREQISSFLDQVKSLSANIYLAPQCHSTPCS